MDGEAIPAAAFDSPGLFPTDLYRISTTHYLNGRKRLFLNAFPPYPGIIRHSIG